MDRRAAPGNPPRGISAFSLARVPE